MLRVMMPVGHKVAAREFYRKKEGRRHLAVQYHALKLACKSGPGTGMAIKEGTSMLFPLGRLPRYLPR